MPSYKDKLPIQTTINFDTIPTIGSTNAVTSGGIYNSLILKQDVLTNPVTGTGTAGQVSYWSGTGTQTGSNNLFWDAANNRLGVNNNAPTKALTINTTNVNDDGIILRSAIGSTLFSVTRDGVSNNTSELFQYSGGNLRFAIRSTSNLSFFNGGNFAFGTTTATGALLTVRGSGTTSSTTALLVQNSAPASLLSVTDNGVTTLTPTALTGSEATSALDISQTWNTTGTPTLIKANVTNTASNASSLLMDLQVGGVSQFKFQRNGMLTFYGSGSTLSIYGQQSGSLNTTVTSGFAFRSSLSQNIGGPDFDFLNGQASSAITSGSGIGIRLTRAFEPTSGTGTYTSIQITQTINQTGGANGITRGLYLNPTLTAAADWRSVEWSNNTGWGLYGAGTANNYLASRLAIGSRAISFSSSYNIALTNALSINGGSSIISDIQISSAVTTVYGFRSRMFTSSGTYTVSNAYHFSADVTTPDTSSGFANQYGFIAQSTMTGATNNYGFYGDIASGTGRWNLYMNGTAANYLAGNTSIGTTTSSARLHVRGSGTTSSTTALLVQNSTPTELFKVLDNGFIQLGSNGNIGLVINNNGTNTPNLSGVSIRFNHAMTNESQSGFVFKSYYDSLTATSGTQVNATFNQGFRPTSGNAQFNQVTINFTVDQTGGANGITRGLYIQPNLLSAADWRSVEFSNNTGWGLYGAGTANNYLGGSLGIGTTSLTNRALSIVKTMTGSTDGYGILQFNTISSGVTSSAINNYSQFATQATAFTLTNAYHYYHADISIGAGSTITNQYGYFVSAIQTATNNYGFYGNIASGTGRWNLYMNGTAANYLAGNTSIGTTTSSGRLTVQGSGTTSSTKALVVNNSTPTAMFEILDNGRINQTIPGSTNSTIFGTSAGSSASLTGSSNSLFGLNAGQSITSGSSNSAIGVNSLQNNTTGYNNSAIGLNAGRNNTTGYSNIFFGVQAGQFIADGITSLTICNTSVFLGSDSRALADSQSNQIVIGFQAIGNGSNTATLGNTSITNTYLRGNINYTDGGNFVIGTTTGTKIGTATSQKIGFYNATPVVQRTTTSGTSTLVGGGGTALTDTDTFDGYTLATVVKALRDLGLLA